MEDQGYFAMGLDAAEAPDPLDRLERRPLPGHRYRLMRRWCAARPTASSRQRPVHGLGRAHALGAAPGLQPLQLSSRLGLAGRARHFRDRLHALRLHDRIERICRAQFEAAALFDYPPTARTVRRPSARRGSPVPGPLPAGELAAGLVSLGGLLVCVQAMLGLYPYAPLHILLVDPHLPSGCPKSLCAICASEALPSQFASIAQRKAAAVMKCVPDQRGRLHGPYSGSQVRGR